MTIFRADAWRDYVAWQHHNAMLERINTLVAECMRDPFRGTGKPKSLRQKLTGWWFRRITGEHRLVYRVRSSGGAQALEWCRAGSTTVA